MKPCVFSSFDDSANMRKFKFELAFYRPLSVVVKDIAIGVGGSPPLRLFFSGFEIVLHGRSDGLLHSLHQSCKSSRFRVGLNSGRSLKNTSGLVNLVSHFVTLLFCQVRKSQVNQVIYVKLHYCFCQFTARY